MDTDDDIKKNEYEKVKDGTLQQIQYMNRQQIRRLNETSLMVYWDGFKALNIKLNDDYSDYVVYVLKEIKNIIRYYFEMADDLSKKQVITTYPFQYLSRIEI